MPREVPPLLIKAGKSKKKTQPTTERLLRCAKPRPNRARGDRRAEHDHRPALTSQPVGPGAAASPSRSPAAAPQPPWRAGRPLLPPPNRRQAPIRSRRRGTRPGSAPPGSWREWGRGKAQRRAYPPHGSLRAGSAGLTSRTWAEGSPRAIPTATRGLSGPSTHLPRPCKALPPPPPAHLLPAAAMLPASLLTRPNRFRSQRASRLGGGGAGPFRPAPPQHWPRPLPRAPAGPVPRVSPPPPLLPRPVRERRGGGGASSPSPATRWHVRGGI